MLRTPFDGDVIQREILDGVFDLTIGEIMEVRGRYLSKRDFNSAYPISSKVMTLDQIDSCLKRLKECNLDKKLWNLTDYHWLLIYEILDYRLDDYDFVSLLDPIEGYEVVSIDKDAVLDGWFWDNDFLFEPHLITPEVKKLMGINEEVFGIANRLKAHSDELVIKSTDKDRVLCSVQDLIDEAVKNNDDDESFGVLKNGTIQFYEYKIKKEEKKDGK